MAEAIASLSLACNIIQVVETGLKAAKFLKETYDKGSTLESRELNDISARLSSSIASLRTSIHSAARHTAASNDELELLELAKRCDEVAGELIEATHVRTTTRKRDRLKASVKAYWNRDTVTDIYGRLDRFQQMLQTRLLVNLAAQYKINGFQASRNIHDQRTLLETTISKLFMEQTEQINRHTSSTVNTAFEDRRIVEQQTALVQQVKDSLRWPLMYQRQNSISDNHPTTLEWIFTHLESPDGSTAGSDELTEDRIAASEQTDHDDTPEAQNLSTNNFSDVPKWFREGQGPFWISGKPGSGKSVCMKFLSNDERVKALLSDWSGQDEVFLLRHFFWLAGDQSQRSYHKMLCSLLYQILNLQSSRDKTSPIIQIFSEYSHKFNIEDWSWKELEAVIVRVLSNPSTFACIFIDGLDEMSSIASGDDDNEGQLLRFVRRVSTFENIKCCISSRPLEEFEVEYRNCMRLRMQDLNTKDIERYTVDRLDLLQGEYGPPVGEIDTRRYSELIPSDENLNNIQIISMAITRFADGVFLWAVVVIQDLRNRFCRGDDMNDLVAEVERYPKALHKLYTDIWHRHNDDSPSHRAEAALYFGLVNTLFKLEHAVYVRDVRSLLAFSIASSNMLPLESFRDQKVECIHDLCTQTIRKLRTRCAGLLEIRGWKPSSPQFANLQLNQEFDSLKEFQYLEIWFIHRSVVDFLEDSHSLILGSESRFGERHVEDELAILLLQAFIRTATISSDQPSLTEITFTASLFLNEKTRNVFECNHNNRRSKYVDIIEEYWIWTAFVQQTSQHGQYLMTEKSKDRRRLLNIVPFRTEDNAIHDFHAWALRLVGPIKLPFHKSADTKLINPTYIQYLLFNSASVWELYLTGAEVEVQETFLQYFLKFETSFDKAFRIPRHPSYHVPQSLLFRFFREWCSQKLPPDIENRRKLHGLISDILKAALLPTTESLIYLAMTRNIGYYCELDFNGRGWSLHENCLSIMVNDCFLLRLLSSLVPEFDSLSKFLDALEPEVKPCARLIAVLQRAVSDEKRRLDFETAIRTRFTTVSLPEGFNQIWFQNWLWSYCSWNESEERRKEFRRCTNTLYEQGTEVDYFEYLRAEGISSDSDHPDILCKAPPMYLSPEDVNSTGKTASSAAVVQHGASASRMTGHLGGDSDSDEFVDAISDLDVS